MSVYNTGTITMTSGLTMVSGYGSSWLTAIDAGDLLMVRGGSLTYTVAGVVSNTELTLKEAFAQATVSGQYYDIFRDFTVFGGLAKPYGSDRSDWATIIGEDLDKIDYFAQGWNKTPYTCSFLSSATFTCTGDRTTTFTVGRKLKIVDAGGTKYCYVVTSAYTTLTTVTISGATLEDAIVSVFHSIIDPSKSGGGAELSGTILWDPGSLDDGAGLTSEPITVTGAALGDFTIMSAPYDLQGIMATSYISAANTARIRIQNETAGTIDLDSGTWKVRVIKST